MVKENTLTITHNMKATSYNWWWRTLKKKHSYDVTSYHNTWLGAMGDFAFPRWPSTHGGTFSSSVL